MSEDKERLFEQSNDSEAEQTSTTDSEDSEKVITGTYVCDCPACATKIYFEREDLGEENVLYCPSCSSEIEINISMLDKFKTAGEQNATESADTSASYVVDCPHCDAVVYFDSSDMDDNGSLICPACEDRIYIDKEILSAYRVVDDVKRLEKKRKLRRIFGIVGGFVAGLIVIAAAFFALTYFNVVSCGGKWINKSFYDCVYYYGAVSNQSSVSNYSYYGYDPTKKASEQEFDTSTGLDYETWDDFFTDTTKDMISTYLSISDAAKQAGMELSDADNDNIQSTIDSISDNAEAADMTFRQYTKETYGCAISEDIIRDYIEMVTLCQNYYTDAYNAIEITDDEAKSEYKENAAEYDYVDFYYGYIEIDDSIDKETALAQAEKICAAKDAESFTAVAEKYNVTTSEINGLENGFSITNLRNYLTEDTLEFLKTAKVNDSTYSLGSTEDFIEIVMVSRAHYKDTSINEETGEQAWLTTVKESMAQDKMTETIEKLREDYDVKSGVGSLIWKY